LYNETDKLVFGPFGGSGQFGEVAVLPGPAMKHPKGIRSIPEWYASLLFRKEFVLELFSRQIEIALQNLERFHSAVGDRIQVIGFMGTDFGSQAGPILSEETYCELFQPFQKRVNDWIHEHTSWKTFLHSCGSVRPLIEHFIYEGFDILNPVQTSAANMDPAELKAEFGDRIVFWGGGVDMQHTLPFATPDEVREQVRERMKTLGPGGGFVFNTIHNVQANTPVENVLAMLDAYRECRDYPIAC
jgi:uroporphyrinogen-III decarboxylase